ncbi:MAG: hypothetical protein EA384_07995 [Spirochaetaceae bacterium]|nr:MAG: hypothetical protein EA384_07995 [Spirochaetaceae bacterium]
MPGDGGRDQVDVPNDKNYPRDYPVIEAWKLAVRSIVLLFLLLGVALLFILLGVPLERFARRAADRAGYIGVFLFVWFVDTFIVPASLDLLFPVTLNWSPIPLLGTMSVASILGGLSGYGIGRNLYRLRYVQRTVAGYRHRAEHIIVRYGLWGVVLAGVSPIPFSTVSWIAGMMRMPPAHYLLGALSRVPRIVAYWALLRAGVLLLT